MQEYVDTDVLDSFNSFIKVYSVQIKTVTLR